MKPILIYLKKLHAYSGPKLYFNFLGITLISMFEGISILLLVPMLSIVGLFRMENTSIPYLDSFMNMLHDVPQNILFPSALAAYVLLIAVQAVLQRGQSNLNMSILQGFMTSLRLEIYSSLLRSSWSFFLRKQKSDFQFIMTNELGRVTQGTFMFLRLSTSLIFTVIQIGLAFWLSVPLTLFILLSGVTVMLFARRFLRRSQKLGDTSSELAQQYSAAITEHFNGIKDIKTNMLERQHLNWFQELCIKMERNYMQFIRLQSTSQLFYKISSAALIASFVYISINYIHAGVEQLALISLIFSRLWPRFSGIQANWEQILNSVPAFHTLIQLDRECKESKEHDLDFKAQLGKPLHIENGLECRDVYYRYDKTQTHYALQDINLFIPSNKMTAIVGKSGAGKSTLIDILIGLVKPEQGDVLLDGEAMNEEGIRRLRHSVSYVAQDPFLFHTSIRENLMLVAENATEEDLWEALRFSASEEFVRKLPQGLDTVIGDRGIRLSGGERQRIVLARALLKKPSILILDEATSALDNENEAIIQQALDRLKGKMTMIVIAHRLSTIRDADQVIVIEDGQIIQQGGFGQLSREKKGTFNKLLEYQRRVPMLQE